MSHQNSLLVIERRNIINYIFKIHLFIYLSTEIVCINENDLFIKSLIHDLGIEARTTATCTQLQCFQYGVFNLNSALLKRDWDLKNIGDNIFKIRKLLGKHKYLFNQDDPIYREYFDESTKESGQFLDTH